MMKKIIFALCIASGIWGIAKMNETHLAPAPSDEQEWEEITLHDYENHLKSTADFYSGLTNFSVKISHTSFKGHESVVAYEKMNGSFIRSENNYRSLIMNILTIQNEKAKIVIDTLGKTIMVAEPDKFETSEVVSLDYLMSVKNIKKVARKKEAGGVRYKMEYNSGRYEACEVVLSEEGALHEIVFLFRDKFHADPKDANSALISPKAVISYKELVKEPKINKRDFDIAGFVSLENNQPVGVNAFKNYRIIDTRLNKELLKK